MGTGHVNLNKLMNRRKQNIFCNTARLNPALASPGKSKTMITVLLFTSNNEDSQELQDQLTATGEFRSVVKSPVPPAPEAGDRLTTDAIVVWSAGNGSEAISLLRTVRNGGDTVPVVIASKTPDSQVSFEALMQDAEYFLLPETAQDAGAGIAKLIKKALENQALMQNIADQKNLQHTLSMLNKKLSLVGSVTRHDVMNQLTAVIGYNELLSMMVQDPKLIEFLKKERMAVEKIQRQFKFAKDYQNIGVESPRWQVIKQVVSMMNDELDLGAVRITVTSGTAAVCADPLFEKVIYNLFENALRHGGGISEISVSLQDEVQGTVLAVADDGTGIPANEKEKIFERGYGKNTGWGLFLVREILEITGMTVVETGVPGKGARFEIHIPKNRFMPDGSVIPATG